MKLSSVVGSLIWVLVSAAYILVSLVLASIPIALALCFVMWVMK